MPNIKYFTDALTALTDPVAGDLVYVRNAAGNRKMTVQNLLKGLSQMPVQGRDGGDIGGYLCDGVDDTIEVPDDANLDFGTGDFSFEIFFRYDALPLTNFNALIGKGNFDVGIHWLVYAKTNGDLIFFFRSTSTISFTIVSLVGKLGTTLHLTGSITRAGNAVFYINGIAVNTTDISSMSSYTMSNSIPFYICKSQNAKVYLARAYNRALTSTEIANIYNNGRPDLYSLVYSERNANNTSLTSGTLTIGKRYRLKDFITGDDFTNVGAASNADGVEFVATGTTPTTWTNSSEVIPIGCVAEYLPHNAGSLGWIESSGNQLSGSTSGSPLCLTKEARPPHYRDIRKAIAANTNTTLTSIVPRGYKIVSIRAKGSDSLADIKIGSASAGEQIVAATTTSSTTPKLLTLAATANDAYSESADVTLYARHDTSASGKTMDLIFHFEKVGN